MAKFYKMSQLPYVILLISHTCKDTHTHTNSMAPYFRFVVAIYLIPIRNPDIHTLFMTIGS